MNTVRMTKRQLIELGLGGIVAAGCHPTEGPTTNTRNGAIPMHQRDAPMTTSRPGVIHAAFAGGNDGPWQVTRISPIRGTTLPSVARVNVVTSTAAEPPSSTWRLRGVTSHARYVEREEKTVLDARSPPLARPEATLAVLIPIRKTAAWWALTQDERRAIFEARSRHIADSLAYLPRIARRLYHSKDLGEPFDFLTWFEMAPEHAAAFDELLGMLRSREEWTFVEREVEVRLARV